MDNYNFQSFRDFKTDDLCIKYFDIEDQLKKIKMSSTSQINNLELQKMIIQGEIDKRKSQENTPTE